MADNDERTEGVPRGNEWEVVSLTASAYAAAPGQEQVGLNPDGGKNLSEEIVAESPIAMFMSGHFIFPPSQHENLPLEPAYDGKKGVELDVIPAPEDADFITDEKPGEVTRGLMPAEFSTSGSEYEDNVIFSKEKNIQSNADLCSFRSETEVEKSGTVERGVGASDGLEPDDESLDSRFSESPEGKKLGDDDFPCECWWKRKAVSFYSVAKETNTFWSIFVAATVMGLVIIGHRWQQERWQVLQLRRFAPDEGMSRILGPIHRLKDLVIGGHRRGSLLHGASSSEG